MRREVDVELYTNNDSHCIYVTHPGHESMRFVCQPQHHLASNAVEDDDHVGYDSLCRSCLPDATTYDRCLLGSSRLDRLDDGILRHFTTIGRSHAAKVVAWLANLVASHSQQPLTATSEKS